MGHTSPADVVLPVMKHELTDTHLAFGDESYVIKDCCHRLATGTWETADVQAIAPDLSLSCEGTHGSAKQMPRLAWRRPSSPAQMQISTGSTLYGKTFHGV